MFQTAKGVLSLLVVAGVISSALTLVGSPADAAPAKTKEAAADSSTLKWYRNYKEITKAARDSKKWILVDVYTKWCHWCTKLDEDVYSQPKIKAFLNKSFLCMKADAEEPGDGQAIKNKFAVEGFPCTLVLDPSGKLKGQIDGYLPANEFPNRLAEIITAK